MLTVVLEIPPKDVIGLDDVPCGTPIFARKHGEVFGMLMKVDGQGWILKSPDGLGATGYHRTRKLCIQSCFEFGYEFFIL